MTDGAAWANKWNQLTLPPSVVSRSDVSRLIREVEQLINQFVASDVKVRVGEKVESAYRTSNQLRELVDMNKLNLDNSTAREGLLFLLRGLKKHAPIVNITLASQVDNNDLEKLIKWFRSEIHKQTILVIGLQPNLIGGMYIRTPNHVYDYSLRTQLEGHRDDIVKQLELINAGR